MSTDPEVASLRRTVVQGYAAEQLRNAAAAYCGDGLSGRALNSLFRARAEALEQQGR